MAGELLRDDTYMVLSMNSQYYPRIQKRAWALTMAKATPPSRREALDFVALTFDHLTLTVLGI